MFKKIRIVSMVMLTLVAVLAIAVAPAHASSASLSPHTISANSELYYYSGAEYMYTSQNEEMYQYFNRSVHVNTGYKPNNGGDTIELYNHNGSSFSWSDGNSMYFKFYTHNLDSSSVNCTSGTIEWNY